MTATTQNAGIVGIRVRNMGKLRIHKHGYIRKAFRYAKGTKVIRVRSARVRPTTFLARDRGEKGRTPESKRWFKPKRHSGFQKDQSVGWNIAKVRRVSGPVLGKKQMYALANIHKRTDPKLSTKARLVALGL